MPNTQPFFPSERAIGGHILHAFRLVEYSCPMLPLMICARVRCARETALLGNFTC